MPVHSCAPGAAITASARALLCRMGGPPKPRPASAANMSKRGLSARLYAPNQTLIMVNARLPKENLVRQMTAAQRLAAVESNIYV